VCVCVCRVAQQVFSSPTAYAFHAEHSEPRSFDVIDYNTSHDHPRLTHKGMLPPCLWRHIFSPEDFK